MSASRVRVGAMAALWSCLAPLAGAQTAAVTPAAPAPGLPASFAVDAARTIMTEDASLPGHTVYHPARLPGGRLPVVLWGNSGCIKAGNSAAPLLGDIAAHGYLVIASGPIAKLADTPRGVPPRIVGEAGEATHTPPPAAAQGGPRAEELTSTADLAAAVSWAEAQNGQRGGQYYHRIDTAHVAVMGTSCGGLQAIEFAGTDARVKTLMVWSSGLLDRPRVGANATEATLKAVKGPILYVSGGPAGDGGAGEASRKDFGRVENQPIVLIEYDGARQQINTPDGGASGPIAVAWLDWHFKGDRKAGRMFKGADCGLCSKPAYSVQKKNLD